MIWSPLIIDKDTLQFCESTLKKLYLDKIAGNGHDFIVNESSLRDEYYTVTYYKDYTVNRIPLRLIMQYVGDPKPFEFWYKFAIKIEGVYYPLVLYPDTLEFRHISKIILI